MQKRCTDYGKITEKNKKSKFFFLLFLIFIFYCDNDILKS